jgi:hypothetical protein
VIEAGNVNAERIAILNTRNAEELAKFGRKTMAKSANEEFDWQPFIGRSLAYLCLERADMGSRTILEQAEFLMRLGMPRKEAAVVVGSTDESLRVLARQKLTRASGRKKTP